MKSDEFNLGFKFANTCFETLNKFCHQQNILGAFTLNYEAKPKQGFLSSFFNKKQVKLSFTTGGEKTDHYKISIPLHKGILSMLPCFTKEERGKFRKEYIEEIRYLCAYGKFEFKNLKLDKEDATLTFLIHDFHQSLASISFDLSITLEGNDFSNKLLKSVIDLPSNFADGTFYCCSEEELEDVVFSIFEEYIMFYEAGELAKGRRVEDWLDICTDNIQDIVSEIEIFDSIWQDKKFFTFLGIKNLDIIENIKKHDIRQKCLDIVGTIYEPKDWAMFCLTVDPNRENGFEIQITGPFAGDVLSSDMDLFLESRKYTDVIWRYVVPNNVLEIIHLEEIDEGVFLQKPVEPDPETFLETSAEQFAHSILEAIGIPVKENPTK